MAGHLHHICAVSVLTDFHFMRCRGYVHVLKPCARISLRLTQEKSSCLSAPHCGWPPALSTHKNQQTFWKCFSGRLVTKTSPLLKMHVLDLYHGANVVGMKQLSSLFSWDPVLAMGCLLID